MYIKDIYILCIAYRIRFYIYIPEYLGMAVKPALAVKGSTTVAIILLFLPFSNNINYSYLAS